ncbi:MAG: BNR repeat-containing protein [Planctomycetota bacterium]
MVTIGPGWARNSVNAVIFRRNSVVSHGDWQYAAYYDQESRVVLAAREGTSEQWHSLTTAFTGRTSDAHNSISLGVDGAGVPHLAWDHHGSPLRYLRGPEPGSFRLMGPLPMTGEKEERVTYPEFYSMPGGDLLCLYRDGSSGNGNLMLNRYDVGKWTWRRVQDGLLDGEGERNAYWQFTVDSSGTLHLSWVWRESGDVATNHDLCYARSPDGGVTWERSTGEAYALPITAANAEVACRIPEKSELINQTSMCVDSLGRPYIATYWRDEGSEVPQYRLVWREEDSWRSRPVSQRTTPFSLSGGGTRRIPISRPQIAVRTIGETPRAVMLFRDVERGSRVSAAVCEDLSAFKWTVRDLTDHPVGMWEPSFDPVRWERDGILNIFVQTVGQGDGETLEDLAAQPVSILEWKPW